METDMKKKILCYGDSNTYGYMPAGNGKRFPAYARWTGQLQTLLGDDYAIIEEGCGGRPADADIEGEEFKNGMPYLRTALHTHKPLDMVILMLGTNDLKSFLHKDEFMIADDLRKMINIIHSYMSLKQDYVPDVLLMCPAPLKDSAVSGPFGASFDENAVKVSRKLHPLFQKIAQESGSLYLDFGCFAEVSDADGVHLTLQAHTLAAHKIASIILEHYGNDQKTNADFICGADSFFGVLDTVADLDDAGEDDFMPAVKLFSLCAEQEEILARINEGIKSGKYGHVKNILSGLFPL